MILAELPNAWRYRELVGQLTLRNMKAGRKQSLLGLGWIVFQPLAQMAIFTLVFSYFLGLKSGGRPYPVFLLAGILTWGFLANAATVAATSVINNAGLVTKVWFPRETLVYAAVGSCLPTLAVNAVLLVALMLFFGVLPGWAVLWLVPLVLLVTLLGMGVGLFCAALGVFWHDVHSLLPLGLQVWFFATPIVYPLETVRGRLPGWAARLYDLNPMVGVVASTRAAVLEGAAPDPWLLGTAALGAVAVFLAGFWLFKKCEPHFADLL